MKTSFIAFLAVLGLCSPFPSRAETVYISTGSLDSVLSINSAGSVTTFEGPGSGLNSPVGLAFDGSGNLYVANAAGQYNR